MELNKKGTLLVVSGPSGSGKGTVLSELTKNNKNFAVSVSLTTREPRPNELDGVHYYFVTEDDFRKNIQEDNMLEYAEYCGNFYGTPKSRVNELLEKGIDVILEIETVGALQVKKSCEEAVLVMVIPPSFKILEERLRSRGTNQEDDIQNRLATAKEEIMKIPFYDYIVINKTGKIEDAANEILEISKTEKNKVSRNPKLLDDFFN